jgi:hypothetical protein
VCQHLIEQYHGLLQWYPWLRRYKVIRACIRAVVNKGCPSRIYGFIDGHFSPFSRPMSRQHMFYSGHKKPHGMVYQAITTPDSLVSSLFGPSISRSNDWGMYKDSRVAYRLHRIMPTGSNRQLLYLYGNPAYYLSHGVISPYGPRKQISQHKRRFNKDLSSHRIAV